MRIVVSLVDDAPDGQGFSDISVLGFGVGHLSPIFLRLSGSSMNQLSIKKIFATYVEGFRLLCFVYTALNPVENLGKQFFKTWFLFDVI